MMHSVFVDNEGNHRRVTDGVIESKPGMGIPDSEKQESRPRRYEVRDAETGEKLSGVSFILTPTGEEMHLLTDKGVQVGAMHDIGVYYCGELHDGHTGVNSRPVLTPIALEYMAYQILQQIEAGCNGRYRDMNLRHLKSLGEMALRLYSGHSEEEHGSDENPTA